MTDAPTTSVARNDEASRYEIVVDGVAAGEATGVATGVATGEATGETPDETPGEATGETPDETPGETSTPNRVAGFAAFHESATHIAFTHTEIDDAHQGQGLGLRLAEVALADAVARDLTIIPLCLYMARYLERHEIESARIEWPNRAPRS